MPKILIEDYSDQRDYPEDVYGFIELDKIAWTIGNERVIDVDDNTLQRLNMVKDLYENYQTELKILFRKSQSLYASRQTERSNER